MTSLVSYESKSIKPLIIAHTPINKTWCHIFYASYNIIKWAMSGYKWNGKKWVSVKLT